MQSCRGGTRYHVPVDLPGMTETPTARQWSYRGCLENAGSVNKPAIFDGGHINHLSSDFVMSGIGEPAPGTR